MSRRRASGTRLLMMLLSGCMAWTTAAEMRTWTSRTGSEVEAEWAGEEDGRVLLRKSNGKTLGIDFSALSEADQEYARSQRVPVEESPAEAAPQGALTLGGVEVPRGRLVRFLAPLPPDAVRALEKEKNTVVTNAQVGIAVPESFDPAKPWNIMVISATADGNASSIGLAELYLNVILGRNWVALAADAPAGEAPIDTSNTWRWSLIRAGLEELHRQWPGSRSWSYAAGGFSGGAKRSGYMAALLADSDYRVIGMFMGGCNEDRATEGLNEYKPSRWTFLKVPIFLSNGLEDKVATVEAGQRVRDSMNKGGFKEIRVETYPGGHDLYPEHMSQALGWFEEIAARKKPAERP